MNVVATSNRRFDCIDCGEFVVPYMLRDEVWFEAHPSRTGFLCLSCVESRLERRLKIVDFKPNLPANQLVFFGYEMGRLSSIG